MPSRLIERLASAYLADGSDESHEAQRQHNEMDRKAYCNAFPEYRRNIIAEEQDAVPRRDERADSSGLGFFPNIEPVSKRFTPTNAGSLLNDQEAPEHPVTTSESVQKAAAPPGNSEPTDGGFHHKRWKRAAKPKIRTGPEIVAEFARADDHALGCDCDLCVAQAPSYVTYASDVIDPRRLSFGEVA